MKKIFFSAIIIFLLATSCYKPSGTCKPLPSEVKTLQFSVQGANRNYAINYWIYDSLTLGSMMVKDSDFKGIIDDITKNESPDHLYLVILYLDLALAETDEIQQNQILAFSTYSVIGSMMYHKLFTRNLQSGLFSIDERYSCTVNSVRSNDPNTIAKAYLKELTRPVTWLILHSDQATNHNIKSLHQLTRFLSGKKPDILTLVHKRIGI